jgi:hypothetical protein
MSWWGVVQRRIPGTSNQVNWPVPFESSVFFSTVVFWGAGFRGFRVSRRKITSTYCWILYSSTLKMEAVCSSEMPANFYQNKRRPNLQDASLHPLTYSFSDQPHTYLPVYLATTTKCWHLCKHQIWETFAIRCSVCVGLCTQVAVMSQLPPHAVLYKFRESKGKTHHSFQITKEGGLPDMAFRTVIALSALCIVSTLLCGTYESRRELMCMLNFPPFRHF